MHSTELASTASTVNQLFRGDCTQVLPTLAAGSVQLVVTSPPYNVGRAYMDDPTGDRLSLDDYKDFIATALAGCWQVLREGGVLAINVPPTTTQESDRAWPLAAWLQMHLRETGWLLHQPIAWVKVSPSEQLPSLRHSFWPPWSKIRTLTWSPWARAPWRGAPSNFHLRPCCELIILASKGSYRLPGKTKWPDEPVSEWLKDVWLLPPVRPPANEPPAFPDTLAHRLIQLYSCTGDLVLDPFAGTGTVGRVARRLGRVVWLVERSPSRWAELAAVLGHG